MTEKGWTKVGEIGVDAGLCFVGDPCYLSGNNPFTDWAEFCRSLDHDGPVMQQLNFPRGHAGLGVVVSTGYGDGRYPVEARVKNGRVMELRVRFDDEGDGEGDF